MTLTDLPTLDTRLHGFRVTRVRSLPAVRAIAIEAEHEATGMPWLHLAADDAEKLFSLAVRTPPPDDTGLPHILEHTVLCGSQRFPVKDPFVELLKSSLATFINAMTYPDRTLYPVATLSNTDYFNLAAVYCDAVFHPLLREEHFLQEGWRLGFSPTGDATGTPVIKGIVYNEMKGAYSDLDGSIYRAQSVGLAPDTPYGYDSGGDPAAMPSLTYADFTAFHRQYYHPSNAAACTYGSIPWEAQAAFLNERLQGFSKQAALPPIMAQPRWQGAQRLQVTYPISADEDATSAEAVTVTWLCAPIADRLRWLALHALDTYLLGHDGAPLYRALIGSGLGKSLAPSGLSDHNRENAFAVGLKGCKPGSGDAVIQCILTCLEREAARGLDEDLVAGALHQMELSLRTVGGQWPLTLMGRVYQRWLYGDDPCAGIELDEPLAALRAGGAALLTTVLRDELLANPHRLDLIFIPDANHNAKQATAEQHIADGLASNLSPAERQQVAERDRELERRQTEPNRPEDLATLPRLRLHDVPTEGIEAPVSTQMMGAHTLLHVDLPANGLVHTSLALDLGAVADDEWELLPLLCDCLRSCGAGDLDSATLATRQSLVSTGVGVHHGLRRHGATVRLRLGLSLGALADRLPAALDLLTLRLESLDLRDLDRLGEVVRERLGSLRAGLVGNGSGYATSAAARHLGTIQTLTERCDGLAQIRAYEALATGIERSGLQILAGRLAALSQRLRSAPITAAAVGQERDLAPLHAWLASRATTPVPAGLADIRTGAPARCEGVAIASDVAFVARVAPAPRFDDPDTPALLVLANAVRTGYLWERIRVQGGAYGAHLSVDHRSGVLSASTYRDPHIKRSLEVLDGIAAHVADDLDLSSAAVELAIIGAIKNVDRPLRPAGAAELALGQHLSGYTAADRRQFRQRMLALTPDDLRRASARWFAPLAQGPVCVVAGRPMLDRALAEGVPLTMTSLAAASA